MQQSYWWQSLVVKSFRRMQEGVYFSSVIRRVSCVSIQYRVCPVVGVHVWIQLLHPDSGAAAFGGPDLHCLQRLSPQWTGGQASAERQVVKEDVGSGSLCCPLSPCPVFQGKCAMLQCILGYVGPQKDPSGVALKGRNPRTGTQQASPVSIKLDVRRGPVFMQGLRASFISSI